MKKLFGMGSGEGKPPTAAEQGAQLKEIVGGLQTRIRTLMEENAELDLESQSTREKAAAEGATPADLKEADQLKKPRFDVSVYKLAPGAHPKEVCQKLQQKIRDLLEEKRFWKKKISMYEVHIGPTQAVSPSGPAAATGKAAVVKPAGRKPVPKAMRRLTRTMPKRASMGPTQEPAPPTPTGGDEHDDLLDVTAGRTDGWEKNASVVSSEVQPDKDLDTLL
eukprot:Hpha_TRINITY_DN1362_c0_g1::TRINITY_DN1362_c0_g1_i1::g.93463::m.93463